MALFYEKKDPSFFPFDKEALKKEILERYPVEDPNWKIIHFPLELMSVYNPPSSSVPDLLAIRNIEINKEVKITANPFSHYKNIEPSVYQIVVVIFLMDEEEQEDIDFDNWYSEYGRRVIVVSSYGMLVRNLGLES